MPRGLSQETNINSVNISFKNWMRYNSLNHYTKFLSFVKHYYEAKNVGKVVIPMSCIGSMESVMCIKYQYTNQ